MKINKNKLYKIISAILLILMFIYLCYDACKQSFWIDELEWTIAFVNKHNLFDMLRLLSVRGYNLPLYYIALFPIYKIAPYGEIYLLLLNFISIILGIYILKKIGDKIGGEDLGFASLCLATVSYILIYQGGFELRPYAFLFLFSAFALYRFIILIDCNNKKNKVLYSLSLILLSYTHWFGCLISAFYFFIDVIRFLRKKIKLSFLLPYFSLAIAFLPWIITIYINNQLNILEYWSKVPTIECFAEVIKYLLSDNIISIILFILGLFLCIFYAIYKKNKNTLYRLICLGSFIWTVGIIFIYGRFINQNGTLYVLRYFIVILPHIFILTAMPIAELLHLKVKINNKIANIEINDFKINELLIIILIAIFIFIGFTNYRRSHNEIKSIYEPYREVSEFISKQNDIYDGTSAIMVSDGPTYLIYYLQKRGFKVPPNAYGMGYSLYRAEINDDVIDRKKCKNEELLKYDTLYIFTVSKTTFSNDIWKIINNNYELKEENNIWQFYTYKKKNN